MHYANESEKTLFLTIPAEFVDRRCKWKRFPPLRVSFA